MVIAFIIMATVTASSPFGIPLCRVLFTVNCCRYLQLAIASYYYLLSVVCFCVLTSIVVFMIMSDFFFVFASVSPQGKDCEHKCRCSGGSKEVKKSLHQEHRGLSEGFRI